MHLLPDDAEVLTIVARDLVLRRRKVRTGCCGQAYTNRLDVCLPDAYLPVTYPNVRLRAKLSFSTATMVASPSLKKHTLV